MELWIRSQDRERLVKVNNIEKQDHYTYKEVVENYMPPNATRYEDMQTRKVSKKDKYIKSVIMCNGEIYLAEYKTKERTLEVLDEIQNKLNESNNSYEDLVNKLKIFSETPIIKCDNNDNCNISLNIAMLKDIIIYEMPQE